MKFTANELLDSMNREFNALDMESIYRALIAYSIGLTKIDEDVDQVLDELMEYYYEVDSVKSFINEDIYEMAIMKIMDKEEERRINERKNIEKTTSNSN